MTLQQLKYVICVADHASMNEAANTLFIAQPSLSKSIRDLELEIGNSIFIRTNKGIQITTEGREFLGYARQVVEQSSLLEEKYLGMKPQKAKFCVSTQHYSFSVDAFVAFIKEHAEDEYDFTLRECRTHEIIEDVATLRSELGVIYLNEFNEKVIQKLLREKELYFTELFRAKPHVFIGQSNPLSQKKTLSLKDLEEYPSLSFEQGENNSFYFSEEILSTLSHKKEIRVSDRATLFNLVIGLQGYTISSGIISEELNGKEIIAVPLDVKDEMRIGILQHKNITPSKMSEQYIQKLKEACYS